MCSSLRRSVCTGKKRTKKRKKPAAARAAAAAAGEAEPGDESGVDEERETDVKGEQAAGVA